jgi:hypothetical protein
MNRFCVVLGVLGVLLALLWGCGVADQPTAGRSLEHVGPEPSLPIPTFPELSFTPTPLLDAWGHIVPPAEATMYSEMRQTSAALVSTMEARRIVSESTARARGATARARGTSTPEPRPTYDPRPTAVDPRMTPVSSGYILSYSGRGPYLYPIYKNAWFGDLPDGNQIVALGGGYHSLAQNDTTPAVGVLLIEINLPPRDPRDPPRHSRDDPRIGSVILPVRDGYARVVDARMAAGEILVFVRTEGGSTYTYDVNSHTLTQTGGPTATPLPPGAPTPTVPHKAP